MEIQEHIQWCKQRALEYLKTGDTKNAMLSILSDLKKHKGTEKNIAIEMGGMGMMAGHFNTVDAVRNFIEGF